MKLIKNVAIIRKIEKSKILFLILKSSKKNLLKIRKIDISDVLNNFILIETSAKGFSNKRKI